MSAYVTTDKFGFADTNWKAVSYSTDGFSSPFNAQDSLGDNVCEVVTDTGHTYSNEYHYCDTGDTNSNVTFPAVILKTDTTNAVLVTGASVGTSNTGRPTLTVTGEDNFGTSTNAYTLTMPTVSASKKATAIGIVLDTATVTRINSSTWAATAQTSYVQDSAGQRVLADIYGARLEATGELVSCTAVATAIADTGNGWALSAPVSSGQTNTSYGNSTVGVFQNLTADT